jgi:hypothetical protein
VPSNALKGVRVLERCRSGASLLIFWLGIFATYMLFIALPSYLRYREGFWFYLVLVLLSATAATWAFQVLSGAVMAHRHLENRVKLWLAAGGKIAAIFLGLLLFCWLLPRLYP